MLNLIGAMIAFLVVIVLIRKKFNFGLVLILGSIILGLFSLQEIEPIEIPKAIISASFYSFEKGQIYTETIELAVLMTLIFVLAKLMQETGSIEKLINSLRTFSKKGGSLGTIPAVYGLMPVPGGALFSAPLIDKEGERFNLKQNQKNFLNVWFRHIWFPIYPISSAMILICSIEFSNISINHLIFANIPSFIAFIIIGFIFLEIFTKKQNRIKTKQKKDFKGLIYLLPPIIPVALYVILFFIGIPNIQINQKRIFLIGIFISIISLYFLVENDLKDFLKVLKKSFSVKLALAIFGIMIFREMFMVSKTDVIIKDAIVGLSFPPIIIIILVPLVLGLLTGYNLGAVGLSYPLLESFFKFSGLNIFGITSLIFMSSVVGYLISPIHLCNVVSSDYLKTDTTRMYKMYIPASLVLLIVQIFFLIIFYRV